MATGFRPGGPNVLPPNSGAPATYDSDELTNYEIGLRTGNATAAFSLDVAAFFLDWEDIQLFQVVNDFGVNANGGTAESKGIEFTATARADEGLSFSADGRVHRCRADGGHGPGWCGPDPDLVGGFDGDPLPFVPEWTLGLGGDYEWSVFGDATAYVGGQVAYTGDRLRTSATAWTAGSDLRAARAGQLHDPRPADRESRDKWSLELYGKNVTDEDGITDIIAPGTSRTAPRPSA